MSQIILGRAGKQNVKIDLEILLKTRALIQANSGGGKSWGIRRLAEEFFPHVQVIIIDPEGEFSTLREQFGYVLVGKGGETPADPRSAQLVAHKLLELRASAVCDLYDLKPPTRKHWVRLFLEALMEAPKNLWHPVVVFIDEAHVFAPEKGQGESESFAAVEHLVSGGRKHGLCSILATQRLAKLSKNVSAELLNRLIGMTFEDVDVARAVDLLSVPSSERREFEKEIKLLEPGHFWALGRAISKDRVLVKIGPVRTTHPEMGTGDYSAAPPPAPAKIKALLPKLADLPKAAEEKAKTEAELRAEIRSLKGQLAARPKETVEKVQTKTERVEVSILKDGHCLRLEQVSAKLQKAVTEIAGIVAKKGLAREPKIPPKIQKIVRTAPPPGREIMRIRNINLSDLSGGVTLKSGERRMLQILAQRVDQDTTKDQLGTLSVFAVSGGTFGTYLNTLKRVGFAIEKGEHVAVTQEGIDYLAGDIPPAPQTSVEILAMWKTRLKKGEAKMLDVLVEYADEPITKEKLGEESGFAIEGGTFGTYLNTLRRNGLADVDGDKVRASQDLWPAGVGA